MRPRQVSAPNALVGMPLALPAAVRGGAAQARTCWARPPLLGKLESWEGMLLKLGSEADGSCEGSVPAVSCGSWRSQRPASVSSRSAAQGRRAVLSRAAVPSAVLACITHCPTCPLLP